VIINQQRMPVYQALVSVFHMEAPADNC